MKLSAVTICINYADFLGCVVRNRRHFDEWVVVTCAEDVRTQAVCAEHGMTCVVSRLLKPDGSDFHAVDAKWHVINEGLEALASAGARARAGAGESERQVGKILNPKSETLNDTWCLVLDADVLLPRHFRERVEGMPLVPGTLYGAAGRKILNERAQFDQMMECEPWTTLVARNSNVIGYFNLFCLDAMPNRYPTRRPQDRGGSHDDWRFTMSFDDDHRAFLPMTVLHTGAPGVNWERRKAAEYVAGRVGVPPADSRVPRESVCVGRTFLSKNADPEVRSVPRDAEHGGRDAHPTPRTAAVIGYFPGGRWREVVEGFAKVWLVDQFQVHTRSGDPMAEADRVALRRLHAEETAGMEHLTLLGPNGVEELAAIPDGSLDLLYLPGELAPDLLAAALPHWRAKLREGAVVCGDLYGLPHWRDATFSIALLLGAPDAVSPDGFWWKRMRAEDWKVASASVCAGDGVVLLNRSKDTIAKLLLSLHSAVNHWGGPVLVCHWGNEDPSLTIACARRGVELWNVGEAPEDADEWIEAVAAMQPFEKALILQPGMIATGALAGAFSAGLTMEAEVDATPLLVEQSGGDEPMVMAVGAVAASGFVGDEGAIVVFGEEPKAWSDAAWGVWSEMEAAVAMEAATTVRMPKDATVVSMIGPEDAGDFQRNWLTWRFPKGTPVLLVLVDVAREELWLPGVTEDVRMAMVNRKQADDLQWLLRTVAGACGTSRVMFVPACASALPGAELWPGERCRGGEMAMHFPKAARGEEQITGNRFVPSVCFALCTVERLWALAHESAGGHLRRDELALLLNDAGAADSDLGDAGWRFPSSCFYVCKGTRREKVVIYERADGLRQLADDVVVVSLPERTDRREQIAWTMAQERVWFRFADGVRVTDEEIDPDEVAEVRVEDQKLVRGMQAFLRGTVGCRRAHLRILEEAYAAGRSSLLLIEDDMQGEEFWLARYAEALRELPRGWLQLYLSSYDFRPSEPVTANLHRLRGAYQSTAILYSEAGIEAAVKAIRRSRCEIDEWMAKHLHPFGISYAIRPHITFQKGGVSDIMSFDRGVTQ